MKTKHLILISLFSAITVVLSQIAIPFGTVPITLSIVAIFLTGAILPKTEALISMVVYILLGVVGLPVFAGFKGGIGVLFGKTGGYIIAYPFMAFVIAFILEKMGKKNFITYTISMLVALVLCYLIGATWLGVVAKIGAEKAFKFGVAPFVVFDLIKVFVSGYFAVVINKALKN